MTSPVKLTAAQRAYADDLFLILPGVGRIGPFSAHWAACAAMIRLSDPGFRSTGGDQPGDLALEVAGRALLQETEDDR